LAEEQAAEERAKAQDQAEATLRATVKAYRKGEAAYRAGLFEAGRLADQYLHQRMTLDDKRAAGIQALEGELARWSSSTVDVNRLIACYHAFYLLAEEPGVKAEGVPYGHYRDAYVQLVERGDKDTPQEHWVLLPGMEERCRELFANAVKARLSKDAVQEHVKSLHREYATEEARRTKAEAEAARLKADAEKAEAERVRQETLTAAQAQMAAQAALTRPKFSLKEADGSACRLLPAK
jgi:hypothetical protein